ncbi:glycosyltransferase family 2 protein [Gammaproteobacteria bacterium]|jgi:glycosyltransferase involved in cell wall biosynthesis|nr:glycosyltransferase family 2 protein [Gammaproteobacteria bacterium]
MQAQPLLTIAIPTYSRASYLKETLDQLRLEILSHHLDDIEIIVSDNASPDNTHRVVSDASKPEFEICYLKNLNNIGSDANIARCFNEAKGHYVLILGDDDLFYDGSLKWLMTVIRQQEYGVICMRPYGFDADFRREYPGRFGRDEVFDDVGQFLTAIGPLVTLISGCVINKNCLPNLDANEFCGRNLVQVHLVMEAALNLKKNLYSSRYHIACKRNNSGGYDYVQVFVEHLGAILDAYRVRGLSRQTILGFDKRMLLGHLPFYLLKQRLSNAGDQNANMTKLKLRYASSWTFWIFLMPIISMPRFIAIFWGGASTIVGRIRYGDSLRGFYFLINKIRNLR